MMEENELPRIKGRIGTFGSLLLGLLFLILCIWLTFLLLKNFYGELWIPKKPLFLVFKQEKPKVALLQSTYTLAAIPEIAAWLNTNLAQWKEYLAKRHCVYKVLTSKELEDGIKGFNLLILPSAVCLSDKEKMAIRKFLQGGGGVLATGAIGARNEQGKWQGWEFLNSLFGVEVTGDLLQKEISASLTLKANTPLSYRVPPGFRLEVTTYDHPMVVKVVEPRTSPVGYWYDFRARPDLPFTEIEKNCGLVYGEYRIGRFIWVGFELGAVVSAKFHQIIWDRLLSNSISWLKREPVGWINPWPAGSQETKTAVVFVCDAEFRYKQALNAARILNNEGIPATFFLVPEEAVNNPEVTKALSENAEVGLHGLTVYRGQSYEEQYSRLKEGREVIEGLTEKKVRGFRPPEELYDSSTIKALLDLGYEYICADSLQDRACPTLIGIKERSLIALPKAERGDYELLVKDSLRDTTEIFNALKDDFLRVYEVNGVYFLLYHSHLLCAEENLPALAQFVKFCKGKDVWFATCKELVDWWRGFENVLVNVKIRGHSRIVVNITNGGKFAVKDLWCYIAPPQRVTKVSIKPELVGTKVPEYEIRNEGRVVVLKVKGLGPHTSQTFFIDCK